MNNDEIDNLKPGKELDTLVAEKVMGLKPCEKWIVQQHTIVGPIWVKQDCEHQDGTCYPKGEPPLYSKNWESMRQIAHKFRYGWNGHAAAVIDMRIYDDATHPDSYARVWGPDLRGGDAITTELPLSVCLAVLKAYEEDQRKKDEQKR